MGFGEISVLRPTTIGIILLIIIAVSILVMTWPEAEAHTVGDNCAAIGCITGAMLHMLWDIFAEEKKQTNLLEQQNCILIYQDQDDYYGYGEYDTADNPEEMLERCGQLYPIQERIKESNYIPPDPVNATGPVERDPIVVERMNGRKG